MFANTRSSHVRVIPQWLIALVLYGTPPAQAPRADEPVEITVVQGDSVTIPLQEGARDTELSVSGGDPAIGDVTLSGSGLRIRGQGGGELRIRIRNRQSGLAVQELRVTVTPADVRTVAVRVEVGGTASVPIGDGWRLASGDTGIADLTMNNVADARSRHARDLSVRGLKPGTQSFLLRLHRGNGKRRQEARWTCVVTVVAEGAGEAGVMGDGGAGGAGDGGAVRAGGDAGGEGGAGDERADGGTDEAAEDSGAGPLDAIADAALSDQTTLWQALRFASPELREAIRRKLERRGLDISEFEGPPTCGAHAEKRRRLLQATQISAGPPARFEYAGVSGTYRGTSAIAGNGGAGADALAAAATPDPATCGAAGAAAKCATPSAAGTSSPVASTAASSVESVGLPSVGAGAFPETLTPAAPAALASLPGTTGTIPAGGFANLAARPRAGLALSGTVTGSGSTPVPAPAPAPALATIPGLPRPGGPAFPRPAPLPSPGAPGLLTAPGVAGPVPGASAAAPALRVPSPTGSLR